MKIFDKILNKMKTAINKVDLEKHAKDTADRIRNRTRLGGGVKEGKRGGRRTKLEPLSDSYKKQRKKYKKFNRILYILYQY